MENTTTDTATNADMMINDFIAISGNEIIIDDAFKTRHPKDQNAQQQKCFEKYQLGAPEGAYKNFKEKLPKLFTVTTANAKDWPNIRVAWELLGCSDHTAKMLMVKVGFQPSNTRKRKNGTGKTETVESIDIKIAQHLEDIANLELRKKKLIERDELDAQISELQKKRDGIVI